MFHLPQGSQNNLGKKLDHVVTSFLKLSGDLLHFNTIQIPIKALPHLGPLTIYGFSSQKTQSFAQCPGPFCSDLRLSAWNIL